MHLQLIEANLRAQRAYMMELYDFSQTISAYLSTVNAKRSTSSQPHRVRFVDEQPASLNHCEAFSSPSSSERSSSEREYLQKIDALERSLAEARSQLRFEKERIADFQRRTEQQQKHLIGGHLKGLQTLDGHIRRILVNHRS